MPDTQFYGNIAISTLPGIGGVAYSFKNTIDKADNSVTPVKVQVKDKVGVIASWGKNNDYPQKVVENASLSGSAASSLGVLRKAHYGNGFVLINNVPDENGKKNPQLVNINDFPEIKAFFDASQIKRFWKETIADLEWFGIAFPEYILSNNFQKITKVCRQKTAWCRFEIMNDESGMVEHVYISQKFGRESVTPDSKYVSKVPLIDSYWSADEVREYCKANNILKFIRPIFFPLIDEAYYPEVGWHAVIKNGWLATAAKIPAYNAAIFENQVTINILVEIDERYFETIYSNSWKDYTVDERKQIRQDLIDGISTSLVGTENQGKLIASMMFVDDKGVQTSAIRITEIGNKLKDGSFLPTAGAANSEVYAAFGLDPVLISGGIPGGTLGAGGGSNKREAFLILQSLKKTDRETTLEPFEFVKAYNQFPDEIEGAFENTVLTTLDANPTGVKTATA